MVAQSDSFWKWFKGWDFINRIHARPSPAQMVGSRNPNAWLQSAPSCAFWPTKTRPQDCCWTNETHQWSHYVVSKSATFRLAGWRHSHQTELHENLPVPLACHAFTLNTIDLQLSDAVTDTSMLHCSAQFRIMFNIHYVPDNASHALASSATVKPTLNVEEEVVVIRIDALQRSRHNTTFSVYRHTQFGIDFSYRFCVHIPDVFPLFRLIMFFFWNTICDKDEYLQIRWILALCRPNLIDVIKKILGRKYQNITLCHAARFLCSNEMF